MDNVLIYLQETGSIRFFMEAIVEQWHETGQHVWLHDSFFPPDLKYIVRFLQRLGDAKAARKLAKTSEWYVDYWPLDHAYEELRNLYSRYFPPRMPKNSGYVNV
jgi:hypothetical protein